MRGCNCTIQLLPNSIAIAVMLNAKPLRDIGRYSKEALLPSKVLQTHGTRCSVMAVASGPAGPVLVGPVFTVIFKTAHAQIMNNE